MSTGTQRPAPAPRVVTDPATPAAALARAEVLGLAVRHLAELPRPTTLALAPLHRGDWPANLFGCFLTTSRRRYVELAGTGVPVFSPTEYEAMLAAAEAGIAHPADLAAWCRRGLDEPGFRLTAAIAMQGRRPVPPPADFWWSGAGTTHGGTGCGGWLVHGWTFERLLHQLGAELVDVVLEEREAS